MKPNRQEGESLAAAVAHISHELSQPLGAIGNYAAACRAWTSRQGAPAPLAEVARLAECITLEVERTGALLKQFPQLAGTGRDGGAFEPLVQRVLLSIPGAACWPVESTLPAEAGIQRLADSERLLTALFSCLAAAAGRVELQLNSRRQGWELTIRVNGCLPDLPAEVDSLAEELGVWVFTFRQRQQVSLHLVFPTATILGPVGTYHGAIS